jgi:Flp pilus assembly protein TadG
VSLRTRSERGAALVETAVVLPFLVLLFLGLVDLGRALATHIGIHEAAQEGALYGSQHPSNVAAIQNRIINSTNIPIVPADITITCPGGSPTITVRVEHDIDMITFVGNWFGSPLTIHAELDGTVFSAGGCP